MEEWRERTGAEVLATSAATGAGLDELASAIARRVPMEDDGAGRTARAASCRPPTGSTAPARPTRSAWSAPAPGAFAVRGQRPERLIARHDVSNDEAMRYVEERLRTLGVIKALEAAGFEPGDDVEIAGIVFELHPGAPFR